MSVAPRQTVTLPPREQWPEPAMFNAGSYDVPAGMYLGDGWFLLRYPPSRRARRAELTVLARRTKTWYASGPNSRVRGRLLRCSQRNPDTQVDQLGRCALPLFAFHAEGDGHPTVGFCQRHLQLPVVRLPLSSTGLVLPIAEIEPDE